MAEWVEQLGAGKLPPDFELTKELLEEMAVSPKRSAEILAVLQSRGIKTRGFLAAIETEAELVEYVGDRVTGVGLWAYLESYRNKNKPLLGKARACIQVNEDSPGIAGFISRQIREELRSCGGGGDGPLRKKLRPDNKERFIELASELEGIHGGRKRLFVRDAMKSAVERIVSYLEGRSEKWLLLGGTRGCGKSVVGILAVIVLAVKGYVILYQRRGKTMLILTENVSKEDKALLDGLLARAGIAPISLTNQVWVLDPTHTGLFLGLYMTYPNFIFVQDLGDYQTDVLPQDGSGKRLIISSPNAEKLGLIRRKALAKLIIMPTWTLEEIKQVEARDETSVESRFVRVGGIPRWVVDQPEGVTEDLQDEQIANISVDALKLMLGSYGYLSLPPLVDPSNPKRSTDLIFRIEPTSGINADDKGKVVLSSLYVTEKLAERFLKGTEDDMLQFASVIQRTDRVSELRGRILEGAVHRAIKRRSADMISSVFKTMSVFRLDAKPFPIPLLTDVSTMKFAMVREFVDIATIPTDQLCNGSYFYYAKRTNDEPTIDAFALVDETFIETHFPGHHPALGKANVSEQQNDPALDKSCSGTGDVAVSEQSSGKLFVLFVQVTVASTHVVDGTILRRRQKELQQRLGLSDLPMVLCFISWPEGIDQHQEVLITRQYADEETSNKRMAIEEFGPQYVIWLRGKFDEIAQLIASAADCSCCSDY